MFDQRAVVELSSCLLLAAVSISVTRISEESVEDAALPHTGRDMLVIWITGQLVQHLLHLTGGETGKQVLAEVRLKRGFRFIIIYFYLNVNIRSTKNISTKSYGPGHF